VVCLIEAAKAAMGKVRDVDYVLKPTEDGPVVEIIDHRITGRRSDGCRGAHGVHEFVEAIEGVEIRPQLSMSASISHPTFLGMYSSVFGVTGTCGERRERDEISKIYSVDTFDVPPNRPCQRIREDMTVVTTTKEKYDVIGAKIVEIMRAGRPSLVIMGSIRETLALGAVLKSRGIAHYVLNDVQTEDEEYILRRAGHPRAVTIATNAAGRGTDIILSGGSEASGGLHLILAFFPINFRVGCQAYGRAARQGQRGSCQIICSLDVDFVARNLAISNPPPDDSAFYTLRSQWIAKESVRRVASARRDRTFFMLQERYFAYVSDLVAKNRRGDHAIATMELLTAEAMWGDFLSELDERWVVFPIDMLVKSWSFLNFEEFKQMVARAVNDSIKGNE
jgi:preprotein translocase subunit SecA